VGRKKNVKTPFLLSETAEAQYMPTVHQNKHDQNKHDRHQTSSRFRLLEDEGVQKHSCQIELRGACLKLSIYYNGKQVLCAYIMLHVTAVLHVRSEDEHADTYTYV